MQETQGNAPGNFRHFSVIHKEGNMKKLISKMTATVLAATLMFPAGTEMFGLDFGISIAASAATTESGFKYSITDDAVTITGYTGAAGDVEIPS